MPVVGQGSILLLLGLSHNMMVTSTAAHHAQRASLLLERLHLHGPKKAFHVAAFVDLYSSLRLNSFISRKAPLAWRHQAQGKGRRIVDPWILREGERRRFSRMKMSRELELQQATQDISQQQPLLDSLPAIDMLKDELGLERAMDEALRGRNSPSAYSDDSCSSFEIDAPFSPTGDQPQAVERILDRLRRGCQYTVLRGATGTGKTFTMAQIIASYGKRTLILCHNKTLAAQLAREIKSYFPRNAVE
eukprot:767521-Hanusia_phi.AAC.5